MTVLCYIARKVIVYTLGHSTLDGDAFVQLLEAHAIGAVADVRRFPGSRRHPQFVRETLAARLEDAGVAYEWLPALGGRRRPRPNSPNVGWKVEGFRGYADHMETDEFLVGLGRLLALAGSHRTAIMCAEAVPWRCHRRLIADALVTRDVTVRHVTSATAAADHALTPFARLDGARLVYDGATTPPLPGL